MKKTTKIILISAAFFLFVNHGFSQLNLDSNFTYQANSSAIKALKMQSSSIPFLGETNLMYNSGHVNSWYKDYQLNLGQSINNPITSIKLKAYKTQEFQSQNLEIDFSNNQLRKEWLIKTLEQAYFLEQLKCMSELFSAIQKADSTLKLRVELGLNSNIDRLSINLLKGNIMLKIQQLNSELLSIQASLKLLNPGYNSIPNSNILFDLDFVTHFELSSDKQLIVSIQESKIKSLENYLEFQKSNSLPRLQIGLTQQSFQGFQTINNREVFFNNQKPFHSVQFGLSAPIFLNGLRKNQRSLNHQIESENYKLQSAKLAVELKLQEVNSQLNLSTETLNKFVPELQNLLVQTKEIVLMKIQQQNLDPIEIARIIEQQADLNWSINEAYFTFQINRINQKLNQ